MSFAVNEIADLTGSMGTFAGGIPAGKEARKELRAAQDFEALLIGQCSTPFARKVRAGWVRATMTPARRHSRLAKIS